MSYVAYTDGACEGNPGPGGWGVVYVENNAVTRQLSGGTRQTTNNQMELTAATEAVEGVPEGSELLVITDSKYVKDGITSWITGWKARNWRTAANKPVKNQDFWIRLDEACKLRRVRFQWVKGHSGNTFNDLVDQLAVEAVPR